MKKAIFLITLMLISIMSFSQDILPQSLLLRTFNMKYGSNTGTSFLIEYKDKNYFITAKHLFRPSDNEITFDIAHNKGWQELKGKVAFHTNSLIDIAVITPYNLEKSEAIKMDPATVALGDEGFFLGYPYGLQTLDYSNINLGFPFPLVKKANFSGSSTENNVFTLFLDGHNNPGFSGGPIFFRDRRNPSDQNWYLAGVISAYINQRNQLVTPLGNLEYNENSGIIV